MTEPGKEQTGEILTRTERCPFCGKWHVKRMHLNIICSCGAKYYITTNKWLNRKVENND